MAKTLVTIDTATDTFSTWVTRTNEMVTAFTNEVLTANNNANGAFVTGNSFLFGAFGSNTVTVVTGLRGGNIQSAAVLPVVSNVAISNASIAGINLYVGNSTINAIINSTSFKAANSTVTTSVLHDRVTVGANVYANLTHVFVGNATINVLANSSTLLLGGNVQANQTHFKVGNSTANVTINSTSVSAGANVVTSLTGYFAGNSTVNVNIGTTSIVLGGNVTANQTNIQIGNSTVNTVISGNSIVFGGNVSANQTHIKVGNSTINVVINSSSVAINGANLITSTARDSVAAGGTPIGTRSRINFLAGNNIFLEISDHVAGDQVNVQINAVATSGAAIIGGTNTNIQFNDSGNFNGTNAVSFNKLSNTFTVNGTIVSNVLFIAQTLMITNAASFVSSTGPDEVDAIPMATYRAAEYVYSIKNDSANAFQAGKLTIINDGDSGEITEYGVVYTNTALGDFSVTNNVTHIRVMFTPGASLSYTCKFLKTALPV